ncbi:MAG: class I SAM-dependent methyltransferase [Candidatus Diapherotrites archaeon]|nr:class I SAM-dependent methyltransferase [Candidatus Diapherotrites archaeon]
MPKRKKKQAKPKGLTFSQWYRQNIAASDPSPAAQARRKQQTDRHSTAIRDPRLRVQARAWNAIAEAYFGGIPLGIKRISTDYLFQQHAFQGNENVLSIGSGTGELEVYLANHRVPNGRVTCIDMAEKMNEKARELAQRTNTKNIRIIHGIAERMKVPTGSQDLVIILTASIPSKKGELRILKQVKRVLKPVPEAKAVISTFFEQEKELKQFKESIREAGLRIANEKVSRLFHGEVALFTLK